MIFRSSKNHLWNKSCIRLNIQKKSAGKQVWLRWVAHAKPWASTLRPVGWRGDALGITSSLNYNHGPWTFGGFLQYARGRDSSVATEEQLRAVELGASYRTSTKFRLFAALYHDRFDPGDGAITPNDTQLIVGARITL